MEEKLCKDFQQHFADIQAFSLLEKNVHDTVPPSTVLAAIRGVCMTLTLARKHNITWEVPSNLQAILHGLMKCKLPTDLAIQASKVDCLVKTHLHGASIDDLLLLSSQTEDHLKQICFLFGVVDCLLYVNNRNDATVATGRTILHLMKNYSSNIYYQLKLFTTWLAVVKAIVSDLPASSPLKNELLLPHSQFVELINLHWETPLAHDMPSQCLSAICEVWRTAQPNSQYADIVAKMTLTNLAWTSKSKFLILATLLPYTHFPEVLCEYPDTIYSLTCSLDSNYLLPAGAALFKVLAKTLKPQEWQDYCEGVLLDALNHSNRTIRLNAVQYWLPCIAHTSPQVITEFKQRLVDLDTFNWLAYISLLKVAGLEDQDRTLARQALYHGEEEIRVAAFGLFCRVDKTTEAPTEEDWGLVHEFLLRNVHSDNAQFRYRLLSAIRVFLIRVLKSCLSRLNKSSLDTDIAHVRQLFDELTSSCLHQNAGYQKKVASLIVLRYILQLFGNNDSQAESLVKGGGLTKRVQLIQLAGERWNWTGSLFLDRFTICLLDEDQDIRLKAMEILKDFFPSPNNTANYLTTLYHQGLELCDSPKFQRSECGAMVMHLLAFWGCGPSVESLLDGIESRFQRLQNDWMTCARRAPVHGFVGALSQVLQLPESRNDFVRFSERIIHLCHTISSYMLDTLAGQAAENSDMAPSFEEMSQVIDSIVRRCNPMEQTADSVSISVQQQLILACCWLNLKESANLAVQVASILMQSDEEETTAVRVEECARVVYQVLIRCRHKGAIEAAGDAMGLLCRRLLAARTESIRDIPSKLLVTFLERLERTMSGASVTRRSAGLVYLVVKIVSSQVDPTPNKESLLTLAVNRLISVAQRPVLTEQNDPDGTCDLPQALAMHLLKGLVNDASLSTALLHPDLMEPIVRLSVGLFDHPHWAVRNAALQLHGSVIPRLIGAQANKTTAELFHKLPGLEDFLFSKLESVEANGRLISGGLIPTLSILSRLGPSIEDEKRNNRFYPRLVELLGHPVVHVRSLAARSLLAFVPLYKTKWKTVQMCEEATQIEALGMNRLHGHLLALHEFLARCRAVALSVEDWQIVRSAVSTSLIALEQNCPCYFVKLAVLKIFKQLGMAGNIDFFKEHLQGGISARRALYQNPGFADWLRLKTELVSNHISLNHMLTAIDYLLPDSNGLDVVEPALQVLKDRLVRLSSSSILANTVTGFVTYYILHWESFPSLLPVCLEFVQARGVTALMEQGDASLRATLDFFLDKCIESRQLGTTTALTAIPAASSVIRESVEKNLVDGLDDLVTRLTRALLDASSSEESLDFRMAAARSLKATGKVLMETAGKVSRAERNLFLLIFNLAQDDERDVRHEMASFLTELLRPHADTQPASPQLDLMSPEQCMADFARQIHRWFQPVHLIPVVLEILSVSKRSVARDNDQLLYEPRAHNSFREETECVQFLICVTQSLFAANPTTISSLQFDVRSVLDDAGHILDFSETSGSAGSGWLFTRSMDTQAEIVRLDARLQVLAICWPSWKTNPLFSQLQARVQRVSFPT